MAKIHHFTEEEIKFIEQNWKFKSDKEIGRILDRTEKAIRRQRKMRGWSKPQGRPTAEHIEKGMSESIQEHGISEFSLANMDKDQRLRIFKENFSKNPRYVQLLQELMPHEIDYYKHKYVEFVDSVDTLTIQEEDSLHHMIMSDISISRTRKRIKQMEEANDEDNKPLIYGMYEALDKAEKKFIEYQKILKVTREMRLKEDKEEKETFISLVQMYRNRQAREEMGRQAALMDVYKDKCKEEMKSYRYLLGD